MFNKLFMKYLKELRTYMLYPALKEINKGNNRAIKQQYTVINLSNQLLKRPYIKNEKVDIVFIFQSPSFWPSWESFWLACVEDERFNAKMYVCDDSFKEKTQFKNAQSYLRSIDIPFVHISSVNLKELNPHIVVLHTPYDGHRPPYLYGSALASSGFRVVYIPYGIEISDSSKARSDHFQCGVTTNAWRVYTFTSEMISDYKRFSPTGGDMVRSFGHPKFDFLNESSFPSLPNEIIEKASGRKVVLWKVHFPKKVEDKLITPSLSIYVDLLKQIPNYKDLFFVFMPHPKFYETLNSFTNADEFKSFIKSADNLYEFTGDDYRSVLMNVDYFILDRSALMVEAAVTGKPILYLSNEFYNEPMTAPVQRLVDSYYHANTFKEVLKFIDSVIINDSDPFKDNRVRTFNEVIPKIDGKSGFKIKEDIIASLSSEIIRNTDIDTTLALKTLD